MARFERKTSSLQESEWPLLEIFQDVHVTEPAFRLPLTSRAVVICSECVTLPIDGKTMRDGEVVYKALRKISNRRLTASVGMFPVRTHFRLLS